MKSLNEIIPSALQAIQSAKKDSQMSPNLSKQYNCPLCQDRGIILENDLAHPCQCMLQKKYENRFRHARMGKNLLNCRFENFQFKYYESPNGDTRHLESAKKAYEAAQEMIQQAIHSKPSIGILFTGPVGSGKTFLAASIANALIENNKEVLFLVVPDLLDELRATYHKNGDTTELDLLDTAREVPYLILDDLGAHNYTEWTKNRIYSIINYRLNEQLPTVITSNLSLDEIEYYLGDRTTSRLLQMCRVFRITCEQDIRTLKYQEREKKL